MSEVLRALAALIEQPCPEHAPLAQALDLGSPPSAAEHTEATVFSLYPYASVYLGCEGMIGGEARDKIAGFFRAIGAPVPAEPDHLAVLLASYAGIAEAEALAAEPIRRTALASTRKALFWEHLASFLPAYALAMKGLGIAFYTRWAGLLSEVMRAEAEEIGPPDRLPLHFAEAPSLVITETMGSAELFSALLSPVRTGMILVRRDLLRAARDLGIAARAGERRYVLSALFSQNASGVLAWLSQEAKRWAARHIAEPANVVSREWAERARAASEVLSAQAGLAREVDHVSLG